MSLGFFRSLAKPARSPVEEREHHVAGRTLPLRVVENERARRLTLRIDAGGQGLRVTVPPGLGSGEVDKFLHRHQGWLEQRLAKVPERPQVRPGIKIPFRGTPHTIVHEPGRRGTVSVDRGGRSLPRRPRRAAALAAPSRRFPQARGQARDRGAGGRPYGRRRQEGQGDPLPRYHEPLGSCTSDGTLSFSWRIMMAPPPVINYLVAHEVAHLKEMNHGPDFWKLCHELCPDTERCKAWLKRNGGALQAIRSNKKGPAARRRAFVLSGRRSQ